MVNPKEIVFDERNNKFIVSLSFTDKEGNQFKPFYDGKDYNTAWNMLMTLKNAFKVSYYRIDKHGATHPEY